MQPVRDSLLLLCCLALSSATGFAEDPNAAGLKFFETKIRPVLLNHCADCHGADAQESELRLDTPGHLLAGGKSGPVFRAGEPDQSLLVLAIRYKDEHLQMPPDEKLPDAIVRDLTEWVKMGAPLPPAEPVVAARKLGFDLEEARQHWAFRAVQPPTSVSATAEETSTADLHPIDRLLQPQLQELGLEPLGPADKRTLIRRATLDLIGLLPTTAEVEAFLADDSPQAFEQVIERLLASPRYGERWGRHWLDVARYADSNGLDENIAHGNAWRYRDYVIAAFNNDKPFDRFLQEQLAGDLLEDNPETLHERLIATGFLTLGPKVLAEGDEVKLQMDIIDEQIDTLGRVFLGLTLGCARCHDHKFDPIRTEDYYALAGIFKSTTTMESLKRIAKWNEHIIASPEELEAKAQHDGRVAALEQQLAEVQKQLKAQSETSTTRIDATGAEVPETATTETEVSGAESTEPVPPTLAEQEAALKKEIQELKAQTPELPSAMGVKEEPEPIDVPVHVRGSHLALGKVVPRGLPLVLAADDPTLKRPEQSGRLELANWLASADHPLTARVWANRVWRWHFGTGLVPSVDNFGVLGDAPTHPGLLDWLASQMVESGWSTKQLHRLIMTSQAYQRSSAASPEHLAKDPENRSYWRMNRRRMDAEVYRDSLLAVAGQLDLTMGGSLLHVKNRQFLFDHTSKDDTNYSAPRRSVYLPVIRNNLYDGFSLFDYADADVPNGNRNTSTVATQALYGLNSELVLGAAQALEERLRTEAPEDAQQRLMLLFAETYSRMPRPEELSLIAAALTQLQAELESPEAAWTVVCQTFLISNEFIYVD